MIGLLACLRLQERGREDSTKVYQLLGWFPSFFSACFHLLVEEDGHTVFGFLYLQSVREKRMGAEQTSSNYSPDTFPFSTSCGQSLITARDNEGIIAFGVNWCYFKCWVYPI